MQDFPANSAKAKQATEPKERIKPVTSAETVRRKRGLGRKFKETFINGDARGSMEHVLFEVLVPSIKDMLFDAFEDGMRRLIYGEDVKTRRSGANSGYSGLGHIAYNNMSPKSKPAEPRTISRRSRARHDFNDLIIASRAEAEEVLDRMFELLSRHGVVSVADLYELTGVQSAHTDMKWGWTELRGSKALRLRDGGFLLDLPDPEVIE